MKMIKNVNILFWSVFISMFIFYPSFSFAHESDVFESYSIFVDVGPNLIKYSYDFVLVLEGGKHVYDFVFAPDSKDVRVLLNNVPVDCSSSFEVGKTIVLCDMSNALSGKNYVSAEYISSYSLFDFENMKMFKDSFDIGGNAIYFKLSVKLPLGYILPARSDYFVTPTPDIIYSDGRRHIISWDYNNVSSFDVSVIFEPSSGIDSGVSYVSLLFYLLFGFLVVRYFIYYRVNRKKTEIKEIVYSHLLESESAVVDALQANMGVLKQKELQDITSFSKAKLSRVITNLESRGIVKKKPFGNSNKIFLIVADKVKKQ
ncbi:MAG: hypothetical protein K0B07_00305 [DPANN group archaeon]|nr:hypothetical protein [DPANN group archaeon]